MSDNQFLMNEFGGMDDWGLQAVVRGFTDDYSSTTIMAENPQSCFVPLGIQQDDHLFSFPDLFETTTVLDELEELYKPFYPVLHPLSPQTILTTSISAPREVKESQKLPLAGSAVATTTTTRAAIPKRSRKNQLKKVVHQTSDNLSPDMWAWRKYGQKPIKGSPYPRSYYRCSSLKGCLARKQVERSKSDPGMFILTYTGEHSHTHPTRRGSLHVGTRNKSSSPKIPNTPKVKDSCCSPTTVLSPTTPLLACIEDEFMQHATKRESGEEEEEQSIIDGKDNEAGIIADMLFPSLEELDRLTSDMAFDQYWFSDQIPATFPGR